MKPVVKQHCIKIMDELIKREIAGLFVEPVDPILDGCPDYFEVILHPMDLTTCKTNLEQDKYQNVHQWKSDVNLIWSNAILFNGSDSIIGIIAIELQNVFNEYTKFFTDSPADDWVTELNQICEDFSQAVKILSIANPSVTKKSPSLLGFPLFQTDAEDSPMTQEEISQLGAEISSLKDKKILKGCLIV